MSQVTKYLAVLRAELEDLEEDLAVLTNLYDERDKRGEITHYTCLENVALLKEEISGIADLVANMENIDPTRYNSVEELVVDIEQLCLRRIRESDFPRAVFTLVKRKLQKVLGYVVQIEA